MRARQCEWARQIPPTNVKAHSSFSPSQAVLTWLWDSFPSMTAKLFCKFLFPFFCCHFTAHGHYRDVSLTHDLLGNRATDQVVPTCKPMGGDCDQINRVVVRGTQNLLSRQPLGNDCA